jgi:hypothetical protein
MLLGTVSCIGRSALALFVVPVLSGAMRQPQGN